MCTVNAWNLGILVLPCIISPSLVMRSLFSQFFAKVSLVPSNKTTAPSGGLAPSVGLLRSTRFSGATDFLWARDCAEAFLAAVDRAPEGAHVFNLHGETVEVAHVMELLAAEVPEARELITVEGPAIPIPPAIDGARLAAVLPGLERTPLADGVRVTVARFRELLGAGRLDLRDLED